jgi:hypothetical protein
MATAVPTQFDAENADNYEEVNIHDSHAAYIELTPAR